MHGEGASGYKDLLRKATLRKEIGKLLASKRPVAEARLTHNFIHRKSDCPNLRASNARPRVERVGRRRVSVPRKSESKEILGKSDPVGHD